jgi:hypothetical protein
MEGTKLMFSAKTGQQQLSVGVLFIPMYVGD